MAQGVAGTIASVVVRPSPGGHSDFPRLQRLNCPCVCARALQLCARVKARIQEEAEERGAEGIWVSCRVTQTYDTGAAVYFYFGLSMQGLKDPAATFSQVEHAARDEILKQGGSLSHHHGTGQPGVVVHPHS